MPSTADDRRLHQRRAVRHPLALEIDGASIPCESVDVSVGGMKVRSSSRIPVGPTDVVISADDESLALRGEVVEALIDASTGEIFARIVFLSTPQPVLERVVALPDRADGSPRLRRRPVAVLAAAIVAGVLVAGGAYAVTRDAPREDAAPATAATAPSLPIGPSPIDAQPFAAPAAPLIREAPIPALVPAPARGPAPAPSAPAPSPAPAPTSRVERTDDLTRVVLGSTAEDTSVRTTARPSPEGDDVRMQLQVTPEPDGTTLPVAVRLENRSDQTLTFSDGLRATVTATRDGVSAAAVTLTSDVTELAPGESITVEGYLDFGATGEYDVSATAEVTAG